MHQITRKKFDFFWLDLLRWFFDNFICFLFQSTNFCLYFFKFLKFSRFRNKRFVCSNRSFQLSINIFDASKIFFNSSKDEFVLIRLKFFNWFTSFYIISFFCKFLKANVDATLRWAFDEANIFFFSNNDESSFFFKTIKIVNS